MRLFTGFPFASLISSLYKMTFLILQTFSTQLLPFLMIIFFMFIPVSNTSPLSIQLSILGLCRIFLLKQEHSALAVHLSYITCFSSSSTLSSHLFQIYLSSYLFQLTPCKDSFLKPIVNQRSLSRFSFLFLEIVAAFMFLLFLLHFLFCAFLCKANIQLPSSYAVF